MSTNEYFLYGGDMSLYTGKTRSYLRKKGVGFETRQTSHPGYLGAKAVIGRGFMPILETAAGEFVQDTTEIIDFIEARHPEPSVVPGGTCQQLVALLLELYGDEGLMKPAMHYRWNFPEVNDAFLSSEFGSGTSPHDIPILPAVQRRFPAAAGRMRWKIIAWLMRNRALPTYGVTAESIPAIEAAYAELLDRLSAHLERFPYLLGGRPCVGDFGLIAPLYAHLGRDPEPQRIMKERAPRVYRWVERMNSVDADMPEFPEQRPEFLPGDEVPETLLDILRLMANDFLPEMLGIFASVEAWLADNPEGPREVRRMHKGAAQGPGPFGTHHIELRGVPIELGVRHYAIWMAQRPMDFYAGLETADRQRADRMLDTTGLRPLFNLSPSFRLERREHQEYLVRETRDGAPP
jgi:glutathione S-transferase